MVAPVNATCYGIVAGQRQQSQRFSYAPFSPLRFPFSFSFLLPFLSALAWAISCCFSIIYAIDISTRYSFRTVSLPHTHTHTHTSIYSCNQLGYRLHLRLLLHLLLLLALHFIYCLRFANSLPCSELRSSSSSPSLQMCWSSAANLMH